MLLTVALLFGGIIALWYGTAWVVFGVRWAKLFGVALMLLGGRLVILVLDLTFGRPPAFSERPWERPWEEEDL
jgi:hypothetical protein